MADTNPGSGAVGAADDQLTGADNAGSPPVTPHNAPPKEIGGRDGPEPTRFGDWEKAGRCIDF